MDHIIWCKSFSLGFSHILLNKKNPYPEAHPQIELKSILNPIWFDCIIISIAVSIVSPVKNWMWCLSGSGTIREWQYAYGELLIITWTHSIYGLPNFTTLNMPRRNFKIIASKTVRCLVMSLINFRRGFTETMPNSSALCNFECNLICFLEIEFHYFQFDINFLRLSPW